MQAGALVEDPVLEQQPLGKGAGIMGKAGDDLIGLDRRAVLRRCRRGNEQKQDGKEAGEQQAGSLRRRGG